MPDTIDPATAADISAEEQRLVEICQAADRYNLDRKEQTIRKQLIALLERNSMSKEVAMVKETK